MRYYAPNDGREDASAIAELLKKAGAQEPAPPVSVDPKILESYTGTYRSDQLSIELKVYVKDGKLAFARKFDIVVGVHFLAPRE